MEAANGHHFVFYGMNLRKHEGRSEEIEVKPAELFGSETLMLTKRRLSKSRFPLRVNRSDRIKDEFIGRADPVGQYGGIVKRDEPAMAWSCM